MRRIPLLFVLITSLFVSATAIFVWILYTEVPPVPRRDDARSAYDWPEVTPKSAAHINTGTLLSYAAPPAPTSPPPPSTRSNWPQFRGPARSGIADPREKLLTSWPASGPKPLWRKPLGEGFAAPVVNRGRVYLIDYDRERQEDAIRCLSLVDGTELWRYTYYVPVKRNHGMSRTVPAVNDRYVVAIGPKCNVTCLDAVTGERIWTKDMVKEFGATVPPWYAGQCPLIEGDLVILAPGGESLLVGVELATGSIRWQTKNLDKWGQTHSSVMPVDLAGISQYVYAATQGVVGVNSADGKVLWTLPDWKISIANVPSPLAIPPDRLFLAGGYDSGCMMLRLKQSGSSVETEQVFRLPAKTFGAEQQTPILYEDHIYGVIPDGQLACMDLSGRILWTSGMANRFGLGPFIIADGRILVLSDMDGTLHVIDATPSGYKESAKAKILNGHDAWGPMALVDGKLLLRDLTEMACVQVGESP